MKTVPWLLTVHLVSMAVACGIALHTDQDGTRLMAWGLAMLIAGWAATLVPVGYVAWQMIRKQLSARDVVVAVLLVGMGFVERTTGMGWYGYIRDLPGWKWSP